jgi:FkbM family methyltransferase
MEQYIQSAKIPDYIKSVKFDIGTSYGAPQSQVWLSHDPDVFVFGFDPNPDCINTIRAGNIQLQHIGHSQPIYQNYLDTRFCLIPVALYNVEQPKEMDFYMMCNDCGTSSLHTPIDSIIGPVKEVVKVPVYSLKQVFDVFPWDRFEYIEYIKIDAQGSDYDILVGAGDYLKERVVYITAEPEMYQYANCYHNSEHNMSNYLASQNFERIHHPNTHDPTYINKKFMHLKDQIFIYQQG